MAYRFIETEAWQRSLENLSKNARVSLPYALDRIQDDPLDSEFCFIRPDGSRVDFGAQGLLIAYQVLEPDRIRLLNVSDVEKEHRW
jgi:hypothetical protein